MCQNSKTSMTYWFAAGMGCLSGAQLLPMLLRHSTWLAETARDLVQMTLGVAGIILLLVHVFKVLSRRSHRAA